MSLRSRARQLWTAIWPGTTTQTVTLEPWEESHAGSFDDPSNAYTVFIDGKRTDISFTLEETEIPPDGLTSAHITIPNYVAQQGVTIEDSPLQSK